MQMAKKVEMFCISPRFGKEAKQNLRSGLLGIFIYFILLGLPNVYSPYRTHKDTA